MTIDDEDNDDDIPTPIFFAALRAASWSIGTPRGAAPARDGWSGTDGRNIPPQFFFARRDGRSGQTGSETQKNIREGRTVWDAN